ncbi:gliding motility-associated C-terminal domain-containing protein [Flavobacterium swingsii]|uniref:Gliding motility-associated C-terminal domain-containing protein n=1 Tax=Flavobacterium swingsii TaxID=498292 RepID=A0A1I0WID8_9FLAO|nr:gliding motility-associated C-terminal domain-containing protein [Flavobacterium swingsii]SFA88519.1 gliding motility-associated C-terminal domain-containing protein [Flavobacterium swingsii]
MTKKLLFSIVIFIVGINTIYAQNITLYNQFNGRYDFTFVGNTLNTDENGTGAPCTITTGSSDVVNLNIGDTIEAAYLYWAGSGTGDFDVKLNSTNITSSRQFSVIQATSGRPFFSAFADITTLVQTTGNGNYTFSELDLTAVIPDYCSNGTNFGGWAIIIVYKNSALPLNQLNVYDGLQFVPNAIDITLNSLNVIDNQDAKIGFLAWEGDRSIAENESLRINGNLISNPPLNPADNAFNGTNSFTGSEFLYNMDLDVYNIQNNINIGDVSATIQLTSDRDFVMINSIVTKLNSQLPDATVKIDAIAQSCNTRTLIIDYTVSNTNSTNFLPAGTFITVYANNQAVGTTQTTVDIPIGESRNHQITVAIPSTIPATFDLKFVVDDNNGIASVTETNENNNNYIQNVTLWLSPEFNILPDLTVCSNYNEKGVFNFSDYEQLAKKNATDIVAFFETNADAVTNTNPIINTSNYSAQTTPKTISVRITNAHCFSVTEFILITKPCLPIIYNHFTPNGDGTNDSFFIENLRGYPNFSLLIYNRWGKLVWEGNINSPDWDGKSNQAGVVSKGDLPEGTYYYVLNLNDSKNTEPIVGWVFLNR